MNKPKQCPVSRYDCLKDRCEWWSEKAEHCAVVVLAMGMMNYKILIPPVVMRGDDVVDIQLGEFGDLTFRKWQDKNDKATKPYLQQETRDTAGSGSTSFLKNWRKGWGFIRW